MPVYDYCCERHGAFSAFRPMSEYQAPQPCPDCGTDAPRTVLSAPHFSGLAPSARAAHATNERSQHAPMSTESYRARHAPGCGCCSGARTKPGANAAKSAPGKRPWMISH